MTPTSFDNDGFFSVSYHYVRPKINSFPRLIGIGFDDFKLQINYFQDNYKIVNLKNIYDFYQKNFKIRNGMLLTFDDGLSDHFSVAKFLSDKKISGVFFINSCIISDNLPPNPTIIHYAIAKHGVELFLKEYHVILNELQITNSFSNIPFIREKSNIFMTIDKIKHVFKYKFDFVMARKILLEIYTRLLLNFDSKILSKMHLTQSQIEEMLEMGHSIGTHTHNHVSISNIDNTQLSKQEFNLPKEIFEKIFSTSIDSFSYPFGESNDCLSLKQLENYNNPYKLIFTVEHKFNTINTSPYQLGRYEISKLDTVKKLDDLFHSF